MTPYICISANTLLDYFQHFYYHRFCFPKIYLQDKSAEIKTWFKVSRFTNKKWICSTLFISKMWCEDLLNKIERIRFCVRTAKKISTIRLNFSSFLLFFQSNIENMLVFLCKIRYSKTYINKIIFIIFHNVIVFKLLKVFCIWRRNCKIFRLSTTFNINEIFSIEFFLLIFHDNV